MLKRCERSLRSPTLAAIRAARSSTELTPRDVLGGGEGVLLEARLSELNMCLRGTREAGVRAVALGMVWWSLGLQRV
jgi:hypothetical protein